MAKANPKKFKIQDYYIGADQEENEQIVIGKQDSGRKENTIFANGMLQEEAEAIQVQRFHLAATPGVHKHIDTSEMGSELNLSSGGANLEVRQVNNLANKTTNIGSTIVDPNRTAKEGGTHAYEEEKLQSIEDGVQHTL